MRTVEEHLARILADITPLEPLEVTLSDARGCVLAEDITAAAPLPGFDNSAMDGYAVRAVDVEAAGPEQPVVLQVIDDVPAGFRSSRSVLPGTAIRIMTGAPMPAGADAIVPVEETDAGTRDVSITKGSPPGAYIRRAGEDVAAGQLVLQAGEEVGPRQIALLAAVGRGRVSIRPRPRVVVVSTGSELVEPGEPLAPGLLADSNGVMLTAAAWDAGGVPYRVGPISDDARMLAATLEDQLVRADLIVTSGGVSAGAYDTVKAVLSRLGTVDFVKVAMQPGMPQGHGVLGPDRTPIITLPGNPVSSYVSFEVFVRPVIRRMLGHPSVHRPTVRATCLSGFASPAGKVQLVRGWLRVAEGRYVVEPVGGHGSHLLGALAHSNALLIVPADVTQVSDGDAVIVLTLDRAR